MSLTLPVPEWFVGKKWLDNDVDGLMQSKRDKLETQNGAKAFQFGDVRLVHSIKRVTIPAVIGQTKCQIETEVVPVNIPNAFEQNITEKSRYSPGH